MRSLTFNPGPSKIAPETYKAIQQAIDSGFLETSHRSQTFYDVSESCQRRLREYLQIPNDYHIFYLDSASRAWHSMVANVVNKESFHIINGAFSKKAKVAAEALYKKTSAYEVPLVSAPKMEDIKIPASAELVTACYNESSTGITMTKSDLHTLRSRTEGQLLAIDATSAAAAIPLSIDLADIWYFSVQKGFGLPAGLGILIVSPRALARAAQLKEEKNNLDGTWQWPLLQKEQHEQPGRTAHTPNQLAIYLLNERLNDFLSLGGIESVLKSTLEKAERIDKLIDTHPKLNHFVTDVDHRSRTIITISANQGVISNLHAKAKKHDIVLGQGYGELSMTTFRIANFPAITNDDTERLERLLGCLIA